MPFVLGLLVAGTGSWVFNSVSTCSGYEVEVSLTAKICDLRLKAIYFPKRIGGTHLVSLPAPSRILSWGRSSSVVHRTRKNGPIVSMYYSSDGHHRI